MDHLALDGEGPTQYGGGAIHVPRLQRLAHGAGRQFQPVRIVQTFGHRDGEAQSLAIGPQGFRRPGPALAEGEVEADGRVTHAQSARQNLFGEVGVAHAGHLAVKRQQVEKIDPQGRQGSGHLVGRHQAKGRGFGLEPAARVRIEADHAQRGAQPFGGGLCARNHRLVAPMDAVEGADRDRRALQGVRQVAPVAPNTRNLH